jgi:hypothetical protein
MIECRIGRQKPKAEWGDRRTRRGGNGSASKHPAFDDEIGLEITQTSGNLFI